jgi:hypothetical protein
VYRQVGEHFIDILVKAAEEGKYIRFIGDNLNFVHGVSQESLGNHKHMVHVFASCALVHRQQYLEKDETNVEIPIDKLDVKDVTLSTSEYKIIREDTSKLVIDIICSYLPQLSFMKKHVAKNFVNSDNEIFVDKTEVIPLPTTPFNEQSYSDDVKILDFYEDLVLQLQEKVESLSENIKIHIGL